jgi:hypothetical protein
MSFQTQASPEGVTSMANPEHLAILKEALEKKDIRIWNDWREKNPDIRPVSKGIQPLAA